MDDNALLNAGQSTPAPAFQRPQAGGDDSSGGFQRPQGVDENTGSNIANAVAQTPNPLHTVVRSMSGAILGALGHAAKLAAQYAPQVAAGMPANTPLGGAARQAGQAVEQERQQRQAEADKQKLMAEQENQRGFERSMADKNYVLEQARTTAELTHYRNLDALEQAKFDQQSLDNYNRYIKSGAQPFAIGGVKAPEFPNTPEGRSQLHDYLTKNADAIVGHYSIQAALSPDGNLSLLNLPVDQPQQFSFPDGTKQAVMPNDPHYHDIQSHWQLAWENKRFQDASQLGRDELNEKVREFNAELGAGHFNSPAERAQQGVYLRVLQQRVADDNKKVSTLNSNISSLTRTIASGDNTMMGMIGNYAYHSKSDAQATLKKMQSDLQDAMSVAAEDKKSLDFGLAGFGHNGTPDPPQPGQIVKGYKFLGGDPSNPQSWQKVAQVQ
ncbi:MAG TPA: hypothetical protein VFI60_05705 [Candidatus Acidoferrum sp.]|nr:hypothetical protein [Candidatus Acidoferrum sp.]